MCEAEQVLDEVQCADAYRFHDVLKQCVPQEQVFHCNSEDLKLCLARSDGVHSDPTSANCQSYIKCFAGQFVSRDYCSTQAVFNGHTCVPQPLYQCPHMFFTAGNDICKSAPNGFVSDPRKGCAAYVRCVSGHTVEQFECPAEHYFDSNTCVHELNEDLRKCKSSRSSSECLQLEAGYYQDKTAESSCRGYFYCYNGNRTDFECPADSTFDGENCVPSHSYVCPNKNPNSCLSKRDGYHKDENSGCRGYFFCSQGKKFRYVCSEQQWFNGTMCVDRQPDQTCQNMDACIGKTDGYYHDVTTRCRKYFFCLKQEVVTSLSCRGSNVFNGQKCVAPSLFSCPVPGEERNTNCVRRDTCHKNECNSKGFHADIDSGCAKYHFCIANTKSVLSCSEGFVFNGELCVPQHKYACPTYCSDE